MIRLRTPQFDSLLALDAALGITYGVFIGTIASLLSKLRGALAAVYIGRRIWHAFEGARGAGCDQVTLYSIAPRIPPAFYLWCWQCMGFALEARHYWKRRRPHNPEMAQNY